MSSWPKTIQDRLSITRKANLDSPLFVILRTPFWLPNSCRVFLKYSLLVLLMCICGGGELRNVGWLQRQEEGDRDGAKLIGECELPREGAGHWPQVLYKSSKHNSVTLSHLSRPTNLALLKEDNLPNPTQSFKAADKMPRWGRTQTSHPGLDWGPLTRVQTRPCHHLSFRLKACCFLTEKDNVGPSC